MDNHGNWLHHMIKDKSIKGRDFLEFLKQLRAKVEGDCYLILDNATIQQTKYIRQYAGAEGLILCFLPPYQPQFQPIELAWSLIKRDYKRQILQAMLSEEQRV